MNNHSRKRLVRVVVSSIIAIGFASLIANGVGAQDDPCDRDSKQHKLKIRMNGMDPGLVENDNGDMAEDLHVCIGDTVEWKLQGDAKHDFFFEFADTVPFAGAETNSRNGKITATIGGDAERGGVYKYDIVVEGGGSRDPRVIVD